MGRRMAVIGGGIGGVAAAYFCDDAFSVDLFEAETVLGGNAATVVVDGVAVDLGAETFHPATHPRYWALLHEIGADDTIVEIPGSLSIFDAVTRRPRFVSTHPLRTPGSALGFLRFTRAARGFLASDPPPEVTLGEWFAQHPFGRFESEVLLPWLASLTSSRVETLKMQSAHAFFALFVPALPSNPLSKARTYGSRIGLGGIVARLADRCANLTLHLGTRVTRLVRGNDGWFVETTAGPSGPYEHVVVNAPPHTALSFLADAPGELREILSRYEYYPARLVIHDDASVMPADRRDWGMHDAAVTGDTCEASFWLGAYRADAAGRPLELFKSWATYREIDPSRIRAERTFHHLLLTPEAVRAARELAEWQGVDGLHFVGHATALTDLQETALQSAIAVAKSVAPGSERLTHP
ncbi:FAD-dependent oxidoreductase [Microbacterium sp. ASV49]|uniref:FAD-dependent oxidoreductase n=1 Tax=Microbacterium candidum TaxID=3041922 RepID=A0ABT7MYG8_9MICO|nr:FAD-dependent oxidoreductase [Microbacterium sp. ASV49]MDL9979481.1 FAD-dependent oxidoreductase [Microbacterium sp. ASV49]